MQARHGGGADGDSRIDASKGGNPPQSPLEQLAAEPIFLVGHPRSGTTWAYDILTHSPHVAGIFESWIFTRAMGLAALFDDRLWLDENLSRHRDALGQLVGPAQLVSRRDLRAAVRTFTEQLFSRKLEAHHRFLVEKTPTPFTDMEVVAEVFPRAKFIHVVRDGRDVAVSLRAAALSWNPDWRLFAGRSHVRRLLALHRSGQSWATTVRNTRRVGAQLGQRYLELRYEEMIGTFRDKVRELFDFCGIPCGESFLDEVEKATDFGSQFEGGEDRFRRRGRAGEWQERFGVGDALLFEYSTTAALREFNYERGRGWWTRNGLSWRGDWRKERA